MTTLIQIILALVVFSLVLWIIDLLPPPFSLIAKIVAVVIVILYILRFL